LGREFDGDTVALYTVYDANSNMAHRVAGWQQKSGKSRSTERTSEAQGGVDGLRPGLERGNVKTKPIVYEVVRFGAGYAMISVFDSSFGAGL
jgi:hypothetical protein